MEEKSNWALTREGIFYSIRLNKGENTIGRLSTCSVKTNSQFCSRQHCKITVNDDSSITLKDSSSNGTYINEQQCLNDTVTLKENDRIGIGVVEVTPEDLVEDSYHIYNLKKINCYKSDDHKDNLNSPIKKIDLKKNEGLKSKCFVKIKKENIYLQPRNIINPYNKIVTRSYMLRERYKNK